jgi:hypothetical protein
MDSWKRLDIIENVFQSMNSFEALQATKENKRKTE